MRRVRRHTGLVRRFDPFQILARPVNISEALHGVKLLSVNALSQLSAVLTLFYRFHPAVDLNKKFSGCI